MRNNEKKKERKKERRRKENKITKGWIRRTKKEYKKMREGGE